MLRRLTLCAIATTSMVLGSVTSATAEEPVQFSETITVSVPNFNFSCARFGFAFDTLSTFVVTRDYIQFFEGSTLVKEIRHIEFVGTLYRSDDLSATIPYGGKWTRTWYPAQNLAINTGLVRYSHGDGSGMIVLDAGRQLIGATPPFTVYSDTGPTALEWQAGVCEYLAAAS